MNTNHGKMINFPTVVMDNFYDNPEAVREFALGLEYTQSDGIFAGKRTKDLSTIDLEFYHYSIKKLFSLFWDLKYFNVEEFVVGTQFTLTPRFSDDPEDFKNKSWIHVDSESDFPAIASAVLYLNPEPCSIHGTSLYQVKPEYANQDIAKKSRTGIREELYKTDKIENENIAKLYKRRIEEHTNLFNESITVKNKYNRIIAYDANVWHAATNFHSSDLRLTQVFFIYELKNLNSKFPIERVNSITL
jgi:hypothetical protein